MKVYLLSLGCDKNLADSEALINHLSKSGISLCSSPEQSDAVIINTCGFIQDAKTESIQHILRMSELKTGNRKLMVMGCLAKRYGAELSRQMPEIDHLYGIGDIEAIERDLLGLKPSSDTAIVQSQSLYAGEISAPLKIAEGCNRRCSFCAIPSFRGRLRSAKPEDVLRQAEALVSMGIKEITLVAQDLTGYGREFRGYGLPDLIRDLSSVSGDFWIRPMYLYPASIDDRLLEAISESPKIVNYIDMPVQHSSGRILRLMRRAGNRAGYLSLIRRIRDMMPDAAIRTSVIVGFPTEDSADFKDMLGFIDEARFDRLGAFIYSREEGTAASIMMGQIRNKVKQKRYNDLMKLQSEISFECNKALVGKKFTALVQEATGSGYIARLGTQAMDVDGNIIIAGKGVSLKRGQFVEVKITRAYDYDLEAAVV